MICDILKHEFLAPAFKYFLQNQASEWIKQSRIRDKETYYDIVGRYLL
jgi:hypothetical protein